MQFIYRLNAINMNAAIQLHLFYGFRKKRNLKIFFYKIQTFCCNTNLSKSATCTNFMWLVEAYSIKKICKLFVKIYCVHRNKCYFLLPHYKSIETLSCHSNNTTCTTIMLSIIHAETNIINLYAMPQLHPPYAFLCSPKREHVVAALSVRASVCPSIRHTFVLSISQ